MKLHFGHLLGAAALFIASCAAFFSVYGIGMLFSGAMVAVIIMGSSLELGKLVTASYLQREWKTIHWLQKTYLCLGVIILMGITSGGIYGFLSSAYQETFQKLSISQNEIAFLGQKEKFFADDLARYDKELERISNNISTLSDTKANSIQVRDTSSSTGLRNTISTSGLRLAQERINVEEENRDEMMIKRSVVADSLQKYQLAILNKQNDTEVSAELGPLIYVSNLTNIPMDKVVNYFILLFIIVFDPLAVALVIATNKVFVKEGLKRKNEGINEGINEVTKPGKKRPGLFAKLFTSKSLKNPKPVNDTVTDTVKKEEVPKEVIKSGVINNQGIVSVNAPAPPGMAQAKQTPTVNTGIKPEDVAQVRNNAKNYTRKIPARRGY